MAQGCIPLAGNRRPGASGTMGKEEQRNLLRKQGFDLKAAFAGPDQTTTCSFAMVAPKDMTWRLKTIVLRNELTRLGGAVAKLLTF